MEGDPERAVTQRPKERRAEVWSAVQCHSESMSAFEYVAWESYAIELQLECVTVDSELLFPRLPTLSRSLPHLEDLNQQGADHRAKFQHLGKLLELRPCCALYHLSGP
ncbi:Mediator Of Rna polymerase Ii Transcription Subunit 25 [Manis pentadactyla]|nr:Mediator Of Rna polymerase Ii Transcription Subunit 25 [Manis pentadactyla]